MVVDEEVVHRFTPYLVSVRFASQFASMRERQKRTVLSSVPSVPPAVRRREVLECREERLSSARNSRKYTSIPRTRSVPLRGNRDNRGKHVRTVCVYDGGDGDPISLGILIIRT